MKDLGVDENSIPLEWIEKYKQKDLLFEKEIGNSFWTILKRDYGWSHRYSHIAGTDLPAELHVPPKYSPIVSRADKWFPSYEGRFYWSSREELAQWIGQKLDIKIARTESRADEIFIRSKRARHEDEKV